MKSVAVLLYLITSLWIQNLWADSTLPTAEEMESLQPRPTSRQGVYDTVFSGSAREAGLAHQLYSDPNALEDLELRLKRVRETGNPDDILTTAERIQLEKNLFELDALEARFFKQWFLNISMSGAIRFQKWITTKNSPMPDGEVRVAIEAALIKSLSENVLYSNWDKALPAEYSRHAGVYTWGDLLLRFNDDSQFRSKWMNSVPQSLPLLREMSQVWAWEDSSVRSAKVFSEGTAHEYWVLERSPRESIPNRFEVAVSGQIEELVRIEYSPTLFFNRVTRIQKVGESTVYHLDAIEKGRTMELALSANDNGTAKKIFKGSEFLRKTKSDEFIQRDYVSKGGLRILLGLRTLQLNQIQELMKINPELVLATGSFGFSITGGRAQAVSVRTDSPQEQLLKMTATLLDIIEFAKTKHVGAWFEIQKKHVFRAVAAGVGAGGSVALKEPTSTQDNNPKALSGLGFSLICRDIFSKP